MPIISKFSVQIISKQASDHYQYILRDFHCDFCKGFSALHDLLSMLDNWKEAVDKKDFRALFTDLWKEFDCISNDPLISKLNAHTLSFSALKLHAFKDYLLNQNQRTTFAFLAFVRIFLQVPYKDQFQDLVFRF